MAIGQITSPASWLLGTPAAPNWFQNAQDNINGFLSGSVTYAGILIDGVGGNPNVLTLRPKHIVITANGGGGLSTLGGTGAGAGPTISAIGSDTAFQLAVTTGTTPATSSPIVTVSYLNPFHAVPVLLYTPANAATAALSGNSAPFLASASGTSFILQAGSTALAAGTAYAWNCWAVDGLNTNP